MISEITKLTLFYLESQKKHHGIQNMIQNMNM